MDDVTKPSPLMKKEKRKKIKKKKIKEIAKKRQTLNFQFG